MVRCCAVFWRCDSVVLFVLCGVFDLMVLCYCSVMVRCYDGVMIFFGMVLKRQYGVILVALGCSGVVIVL